MKLTVFTPTYNRAHLLGRVYESLKNQTCKDFCWLIVDDGSTDRTKEVVHEFINENLIPIRYEYKANGGKMRAHNLGVQLCDTPLFVCLDSDDYFTVTAVEDIISTYELIPKEEQSRFAGIVAHKGKSETELLSMVEFPDVSDTTLYGLYLRGFSGETTLVFRTEVIAEYPFPEFEGEKYVPEDYVYDKIDKKYVLKVLPKILTVCEIVEQGYTDSVKKLKQENKQAWCAYYEQRARITKTSVLRMKYVSFYMIYAKRCKRKIYQKETYPWYLVLPGFLGAMILLMLGKE